MFKNISTFWERLIRTVFYILAVSLIIFCVAMFFASCNPQAKLIRQQDKAYGITVSTPRTFAQAGALWVSINPCLTPIIKDSIATKHDTITTEKKVFIPLQITQYKTRKLDTIVDGVSIYIDSLGISIKNLNEKEVTTKTVYQTKIDETRVNNLTDSVNSLKQQLSFKQGQLESLSDTSQEQKKSIEKWLIFFIISAVVNLVLLILWIKSYFKL